MHKLIKWNDRRSYIDQLSRKDKVRFALFCAKQAIHLTEAPEAKECIRVIELWLEGKASADDCERAANAYIAYANHAAHAYIAAAHAAHAAAAAAHAATAINAAATAARAAAHAATNAAYAAAYATYAATATVYANAATAAATAAIYAATYANTANTADIKQAQMRYLYELINIDSIVEQTLLGCEICYGIDQMGR